MGDTNPPRAPSPESQRHKDWPRLLEWVEKQAQESLKARFFTAELIAREAQTTLTVLLAGIGGSAAYGAKIFEQGSPGLIAIASAAVCVYLVVLSIFLVVKCMILRGYPALYQDPENLMHPTHSLNEVREAEVNNLGGRIAEATKINALRAKDLNKVRIALALSPIVFAVATIVAPPAATPSPTGTTASCKVEPAASDNSIKLNCSFWK